MNIKNLTVLALSLAMVSLSACANMNKKSASTMRPSSDVAASQSNPDLAPVAQGPQAPSHNAWGNQFPSSY